MVVTLPWGAHIIEASRFMKLLNYNTISALALVFAVNCASADMSRDQLNNCFKQKTAQGCVEVVGENNAVLTEGQLRGVDSAEAQRIALQQVKDKEYGKEFKAGFKGEDPRLRPIVEDSQDFLVFSPFLVPKDAETLNVGDKHP